ncbi:C-GCAxxG-C-C family protein [bacterium]|nr:C-GCAxxG-C-C family protein [bacterium]
MEDKVKSAVDTYRNTEFNCAQSVLSEFAPRLGMDEKTAMKVACGLGSGMGRSGNICGAISGGMLVLGLKYGMTDPDSPEDKKLTYQKVCELLDKVIAKQKFTNCTDLMGVDIGTEEGRQEAKDKDLSNKVCSKIVGDVARILEELL